MKSCICNYPYCQRFKVLWDVNVESFGKYFPMFQRIVLSPSSEKTSPSWTYHNILLELNLAHIGCENLKYCSSLPALHLLSQYMIMPSALPLLQNCH